MHFSLTPELERKIALAIEDGGYGSAEALVQDALNRFFDAGVFLGWTPDAISAAIEVGWAQAERGELIDGEVARRDSLKKILKLTA